MRKSNSFVARVKLLVRSYWFVMVVLLVLSAVVLTFFLEYRYFLNDFGRTWQFFIERPLVFWYNAYLVLLALLLLTGLTRRPAIAVGVLLAIIIAISYVNVTKFELRGYPLLPEDLLLASEADSMSKMINVGGIVLTGMAMAMAVGASVVANVFIGRWFKLKETREEGQWWQRFAVVPRLVLIVTAMALLVVGTDFVRNHSGQKYEAVPWLNSQLVAWNQVRNYDYNGFILGFLYNLQKFDLVAPEGYSKERIEEILDKYEEMATNGNALRTEPDINFVVVLDESFIDTATIEQYYPHTGGDVTPNLHALQEKYPSGKMYSLDYGGGTANIEFEVLTGLSNYWSNTVPYTALVPKAGKIPSAASFFGAQGYSTTGIHTFNGSMYKRDIAFGAFGIDKFITEREIKYTEKEGNSEYINDRSAFTELEDVLATGNKQFAVLVTMQNHLPYANWIYGDGAEMPFTMSGEMPVEEWRRDELAVYYRLLNASDKYLGEFLRELETREEKTVVLFFGDHFPGLYPEIHNNEDSNRRDAAQETPYFIYTNFDSKLERMDLPTTTPNCLVNTTFNLLGMKKPPLYYMLDKVCTETPILAHLYLGEDGYEASEAMNDYELVNYDLLGGGKYWSK